MVLFQTKRIKTVIIFIIVMVVFIWLFQNNYIKLSIFQKSINQSTLSNKQVQENAYLEKIDNFIIKEYSKKQILLHTIQAQTYFSYKNSPIKLIDVEVKTFNSSQKESLVLISNRAEILKSGEIFFNEEVNIKTSTGVYHELDTESLIVLSDVGKIKSNREVTYLGNNAKINAKSMEMDIDSDTMILKGKVNIFQDSGAKITTTDLFINHENGEKKYNSQNKTSYLSNKNKVNSEKGIDMDMNQNLIKLLGKVEILDFNGGSIKTTNLLIDQSNGGEIFKSNEPSHLKSNTVDIKAKQMHYDAITKKLKLMEQVTAEFMNRIIIFIAIVFSTLVSALPEDVNQPIEIEADSVIVDEISGFNEFLGDAEVRQGSLLITAELIQVQTNSEGVETMIAKGTIEKPAKYIQSQENQARFIEATADLITYDVNEGMVFLVGNAYLIQGFDSFSGDSLNYDINNDKVIVKSSEDGTERVKFKIVL